MTFAFRLACVFCGILWMPQIHAQNLKTAATFEDAFLAGVVEIRIADTHRDRLESGGIMALPWPENLLSLPGFEAQLRFPHIKKPVQRTNAQGLRMADLSLFATVRFNESLDPLHVIRLIHKSGIADIAEPHFVPQLAYSPNDDSLAVQYALSRIQATAAWEVFQGDSSMVVGITDTGNDLNHPDLIQNIAYNYADPINGMDDDNDGYLDNFRGWDVGMNDNDPTATGNNFHGQHVSGIAAASTDNTIGIAGSGFRCRFLPVKISNATGALTAAFEGIVYAAEHGCGVINCSWGGNTYSALGDEIIRYASVNLDRLVVCAAGNNANNTLFYPAAYDYVLSVGSTTSTDAVSGFSNYGYFLHVFAPGSQILSTWTNGTYIKSGGTSMAAPLTAGAAALLRAYHPTETSQQIAERLKNTADDITALNPNLAGQLGFGRINLGQAVNAPGIPAPSMHDIVLTGTQNNLFLPGDTLQLSGIITNYLASAQSVVLRIYSLDGQLSPLQTATDLGAMPTLDTRVMGDGILRFRVADNASIDSETVLRLEFESDGHFRNQYVTLRIYSDMVNIHNNRIGMSVGSSGRFGISGTALNPGLGFQYDALTDLLYDGGLMIGNAATAVADHIYADENDFNPLYRVAQSPPWLSNLEVYQGAFDGLGANFPYRVHHKIISDANDPNRSFVIMEYRIVGNSGAAISNAYAGLFTDWDVINAGANNVGFDAATRTSYIHTVPNDSVYTGVSVLSNQDLRFYAIDNVSGGAGGVNIYDGFSESEKYTTLSTNRLSTTAGAAGTDVICVTSAGPFTISENDTVTVAFALLAGRSQEEILLAAQHAYDFYLQGGLALGKHSANSDWIVYPNPTSDVISVLRSDATSDDCIEVFDMQGRRLLRQSCVANPSLVSLEALPAGAYKIVLQSGTHIRKQTIIKQ